MPQQSIKAVEDPNIPDPQVLWLFARNDRLNKSTSNIGIQIEKLLVEALFLSNESIVRINKAVTLLNRSKIFEKPVARLKKKPGSRNKRSR